MHPHQVDESLPNKASRVAGVPIRDSDRAPIVRARGVAQSLGGAVEAAKSGAEAILVAIRGVRRLEGDLARSTVSNQKLLGLLGPLRGAVKLAAEISRYAWQMCGL